MLEGMFLINTVPLGTCSKMQEYATFLLRRFVLPHLVSGTQELHIVFDNLRPHSQSPKAFEHKRRDVTNALPSDHKTHFTNHMAVPTKWHGKLSCTTCKRQLVEYLGKAFLEHAPGLLWAIRKWYWQAALQVMVRLKLGKFIEVETNQTLCLTPIQKKQIRGCGYTPLEA